MTREPLDVNLVLSRTLRLRGYQLSSNKIELETDLAPELPAVVGDARQLQQVCLNLVTNAVQAMTAHGGGGTLFVSTRRDDDRVERAFPNRHKPTSSSRFSRRRVKVRARGLA